jgi:DNA repair exonuclease SbcCD ATPase subunit
MSEAKGRKFGLKADAMPTPPTETVTVRPSYTKEYLSHLRDSTPSTPKDITRYLSDDSPDSGMSAQPSIARPAEILDEAVVRALKERRRERARGEDYMSLNEEEDDRPRKVVSDDEDETYKAYVDEPVRLQKNMEAATKKHKQEQIQEALYHSDSEAMSDVDEDEWENQQIAKTHPGLVKPMKRDVHAMPSEIPPVTSYAAALSRLRAQVETMKSKKMELQQMVDNLEKERDEIRNREEAVQESLTKAGKEYEQLREEFKASGANRGLDEVGEFGTPASSVPN